MNASDERTPLFTIVIPAYNAEKYLADAVASIRAQTSSDWECVIVDDGSTDGTGSLADRLVAQDQRLRVIHQANAGLGGARNSGIETARGKWILYLDADDAYHPQALARLAAVLSDELDFVEFKSVHCAERPDFAKDPAGTGEVRAVTGGRTLTSGALGSWTVWNVAWRLATVRSVRFSQWITEDTLYRVNVICRVHRYAFLDSVLHWYRAIPGTLYQSGLTPAKVTSQLHSYLDMADCLAKTKRPIEPRLRRKIGNAIVCRTIEQLFGPWGEMTDEGRAAFAFWQTAVSEPAVQCFLPIGLRQMAKLSCRIRIPGGVFLVHIVPYRCLRAIHEAFNALRRRSWK